MSTDHPALVELLRLIDDSASCEDCGRSVLDEGERQEIDVLARGVFAAGRRVAAEEIARAIEVSRGERCPECGGLPASSRWVWAGYRKVGRCGAGHTWTATFIPTPATIAREVQHD